MGISRACASKGSTDIAATANSGWRTALPRRTIRVKQVGGIPAEECPYARTWTSEARRAYLLGRWIIHDNDHRPHTALGNPRLPGCGTNVMASYL